MSRKTINVQYWFRYEYEHENCTFLPSNAAIILCSCGDGAVDYGSVMIPLFCYNRMAHSFKASMLKRVCNMDWAHRLSNTACFDRDIWEFFAVLCTVHVDQRLGRPPDLVSSMDSDQGHGFVADGSDVQRNIPPLGPHLFLKFWKEKKEKKIKQTK